MSRRIEIELTSTRDDGSFTWRAAGAKEPKGVVQSSRLPQGANVGDTFRVELDVGLDGTEITQVLADRAPRREADRLELIVASIPDDALVTSRLATRSKGRSDKRRGKGDRPARSERKDGQRKPRDEKKERPKRAPRPERAKVRVPRLRPGNTHRQAFLTSLADEERPVAEKLAHGGLPGLRQALEADNAKRKEQGQPEVPIAGLIDLGEKLLPRYSDAEWLDRAEAAIAAVDTVDLRDLRSVVVAADNHARTQETRELAAQLRDKLSERVEAEHSKWLADLESALNEKRIVRVLNLSSRPPKAGSPLPEALNARMIQATNEALEPGATTDRWITLVDALAFAPFRLQVAPTGVPTEVDPALLAKVTKLASRLPNIAAAFGANAAK